jgi:hypothetical protein
MRRSGLFTVQESAGDSWVKGREPKEQGGHLGELDEVYLAC